MEDEPGVVADVREAARIDLVFDHEPIAVETNVEHQRPARQDVGPRKQRKALVELARRLPHLYGPRRGYEILVPEVRAGFLIRLDVVNRSRGIEGLGAPGGLVRRFVRAVQTLLRVRRAGRTGDDDDRDRECLVHDLTLRKLTYGDDRGAAARSVSVDPSANVTD